MNNEFLLRIDEALAGIISIVYVHQYWIIYPVTLITRNSTISALYKNIFIWKDSGSFSICITHSFDSFSLTQSKAEIGASHEHYHDNNKNRAFPATWVYFICNLLDCRLVIFTSSSNLCRTSRPEEHQTAPPSSSIISEK